jgi:hypothetical protein
VRHSRCPSVPATSYRTGAARTQRETRRVGIALLTRGLRRVHAVHAACRERRRKARRGSLWLSPAYRVDGVATPPRKADPRRVMSGRLGRARRGSLATPAPVPLRAQGDHPGHGRQRRGRALTPKLTPKRADGGQRPWAGVEADPRAWRRSWGPVGVRGGPGCGLPHRSPPLFNSIRVDAGGRQWHEAGCLRPVLTFSVAGSRLVPVANSRRKAGCFLVTSRRVAPPPWDLPRPPPFRAEYRAILLQVAGRTGDPAVRGLLPAAGVKNLAWRTRGLGQGHEKCRRRD